MAEAIDILKQQGAVIVDPADIPSVVSSDPATNFLLWPICAAGQRARARTLDCSVVFKYGMKRDFNKWLASLGPAAPVKTLTELRQWNVAHQKAGAIKYGQAQLDISDEMDVEADRARYRADRDKDLRLAATHGIDAVMKQHRLDALLFPARAVPRLRPSQVIPPSSSRSAIVPNAPTPPFPEGFDAKPAPFGVSFTGTACSEPRLIELAYAFEQATKRRVPPQSAP